MENKTYLIREIYDSLSYDFDETIFEFYCNDINFLLGDRGTGKTTISFINAIAEASLNPRRKIGFCTDSEQRYVYILLIEFCDKLGLDYYKDDHTLAVILPNNSYIQIMNLNNIRGHWFDYIIADMHCLFEDDYNRILVTCKDLNSFKIVTGTQTDFIYDYVHNNEPYAILGDDHNTCHILY